jgi:hypothetical protein
MDLSYGRLDTTMCNLNMMSRCSILFSLLSLGCLVQAAPSDPILQARAAAVKRVPGYLYQGW